MAAHQVLVTPGIGCGCDFLMFMPHDRPELPSLQSIPVAQMKKRIDVVVCDHIALPGLNIDRHQNETDLVAKKPILEMAIDRKQSRVVQLRNGRSLLKINGKQSKPVHVRFALGFPARKVKYLENVESIFRSEPVKSKDRVDDVELFEI